MKLQSSHVKIGEDLKVHSIVPCLQSDEVILACNDKSLYQCNLQSGQKSEPIQLNSCPLKLAWQPLSLSQRSADSSLAVGCSDGSVEYFQGNSIGKPWPLKSVRKIKAHDGSVTSVCWSHDDSSLATSGVDGEVKIWSRVGHLRMKLASFDSIVNCLSWGPSCESVLIAHGKYLSMTKVHGRSESVSWGRDDSGIILAVDWNFTRNLIVSGDELGLVNISTPEGVCVHSSQPQSYPITSISWFPTGDYFAIGAFGILGLLDAEGNICEIIESSEKSSILQLCQRPDTSQLVGGSSTGEVAVLNLVGQIKYWSGVSVELCSTNRIKVATSATIQPYFIDLDGEGGESEMVIKFDVSFGNVVVLTMTKCRIYNVSALDAPVSIELKDDPMYDVRIGPSHLAIIGWDGVRIYSHRGKYLSSLNYQFTSASKIPLESITIGDNMLGIIDDSDEKIIRLFSCETGDSLDSNMGKITHDFKVKQIFLSQLKNADENYIIIIDSKEDLFIRAIQTKYFGQDEECRSFKLGRRFKSAAWDEKSNMICCLQESKAVIYYFPLAPFIDIDLLKDTTEMIDLGEKIKCARVESMCGSRCTVSLQDESIIHLPIPEGCSFLHEYISSGYWDKCVRMCRFRNNPIMWAILALEGTRQDAFDAVESALMAIKAIDKLNHLRSIRKMPPGERKSAELSLYKRNPKEAISTLLEARPPLIYDAINTCLRMFRWEQALSIAKGIGDTDIFRFILWYRAEYLQNIDEKEYVPSYNALFSEIGVPASQKDFDSLESKMKNKYNALVNEISS